MVITCRKENVTLPSFQYLCFIPMAYLLLQQPVMPILLLNVFQQEVNLKYVSIHRGVLIGLSVIQLKHRR